MYVARYETSSQIIQFKCMASFRVIFLMKLRWPQNESLFNNVISLSQVKQAASWGSVLEPVFYHCWSFQMSYSVWSTYVLVLQDEHVSLGYLTTGSVFIQYCITSCLAVCLLFVNSLPEQERFHGRDGGITRAVGIAPALYHCSGCYSRTQSNMLT